MMYVRFLGERARTPASFIDATVRQTRTGFYWQENGETDRTNGQNDWIKTRSRRNKWSCKWRRNTRRRRRKKNVESERVTITWVVSIIEVREKEIFALGNLCALFFAIDAMAEMLQSPLGVNHIGAISHGAGYGRFHVAGWWPLLGVGATRQ